MSSEETCGIAYNAMHMGASKKLGEEESESIGHKTSLGPGCEVANLSNKHSLKIARRLLPAYETKNYVNFQ